jgi:hypothetical protein
MSARFSLLVVWIRAALASGDERGQAAVEYAVMTGSLLLTTALAAPFILKFAPDMINALQIYVNGFYFVLSLPFP